MSIKGLTDKGSLAVINRDLPGAGKFKKGEPKPEAGNRPGKDLKDGTFRIDYADGMEWLQPFFETAIPDTSAPIVIQVLGNSVQTCLDDYFRLYGGNNVAKRLCDGGEIVFPNSEKGHDCLGCPSRRVEAKETDNKPPKGDCTPMGYFRFTIPALNRLIQHEVSWQIDMTSENELRQFAKELQSELDTSGQLLNKMFLLRRYPRTFNRDGYKDEKSLMYLSANLSSSKPESQTELLSGQGVQSLPAPAPQLESGVGNGDVTGTDYEAERKEGYLAFFEEAIPKFLNIPVENFLSRFMGGDCNSLDEMYRKVDDLQTARDLVMKHITEGTFNPVSYGCIVEQHGKTVKMGFPFGFGTVYGFTRNVFSATLQPATRESYFDDGTERSLSQVGNHAFKNVFVHIDRVVLSITLNGEGKLTLVTVSHPEEDIPF